MAYINECWPHWDPCHETEEQAKARDERELERWRIAGEELVAEIQAMNAAAYLTYGKETEE